MKRKPTHGGRRPGAGRPRTLVDRRTISLSLDGPSYLRLCRLALERHHAGRRDCTLSEVVRDLIAGHRT